MAYNKNEKTLAADVKISLLDAFEKQWKSPGQVQTRSGGGASVRYTLFSSVLWAGSYFAPL